MMDLTVVALAGIVCGTILVGLIVQGVVDLRRKSSPAPRQLDAIETRLANIEQVLDGIAVEVERVSEAHRFSAKLLAERAREPVG